MTEASPRRPWPWALALMLQLGLTGACAPAAFGAEPLRVAVNTTTVETLPIYMAVAASPKGSIALTGGALPLLISGKVDAATNAETQALLRSPENPGIRVILTVAEYAYSVVARRSSGISTAANLRGKKIATAVNSSAHFYLTKLLRSAGLTEQDVTVVSLAPADMPAALSRGDVDAISIWEPPAINAEKALGADAVILHGPAYSERFDLNTTTEVLNDPARRAALVALLRSIIAASRDIKEHPEQAQTFIADKLGLPVETVKAAWGRFSFPAAIGDDLLDTMTEQEPWMATKQNRAPRSQAAVAALIDASLWRDASKPQ